MTGPARTALRYPGGKWKIAPWIISYFPSHEVYLEAFGGGGGVLMRKKPARVEIYNDLSSEIVNLFRVLRDPEQSERLREMLDLTPWSREEWERAYELHDDPLEQARRTIVLCLMGHSPGKSLRRESNGWRSSSSGDHVMTADLRRYTKNLIDVTARLKDVMIENRPATKIIKQHDSPVTLHYLDPPYPGDTRVNKRKLYKHEMMSLAEHEQLAKQVRGLKGFVVLSGYECDEYDEWYTNHGFRKFGKQAVTGAGKRGGSHATEVVWLNPRAAAEMRQLEISFK